jgi:hypothetical protein
VPDFIFARKNGAFAEKTGNWQTVPCRNRSFCIHKALPPQGLPAAAAFFKEIKRKRQ